MESKSGFVSIVGRPNVGKSTLLNSILGQKIAIVSDKPQTTRNRIQGIHTCEQGQVIFIDTPGIHKPKHKLGELMVNTAATTLSEVDMILYVVDVTVPPGPGEDYIISRLVNINIPVFLVPNKVDLVGRKEIDAIVSQYENKMNFSDIVPVSAVTKQNLDVLINRVFEVLPVGPMYYPEEDITDQPERFLAAEFVREKVLRLTRDEVPHSIAVEIETFEDRPNDTVFIRAAIYTERESQKGIIIGKNGSMLKKVGEMARKDMEELLDCKVYLELWVKVRKDWRNSDAQLKNLGYNP